MELTRENKIQFEKWYNEKPINNSLPVTLGGFKKLSFEMQIGVFLAYYLEKHNLVVSVSIGVNFVTDNHDGFDYDIHEVGAHFPQTKYAGHCTAHAEAYEEAFKQANIIVNNKCLHLHLN